MSATPLYGIDPNSKYLEKNDRSAKINVTKAKITVLFVCYFFSLKNVLKRCPNTFKRYPYNFYSKFLRFAASNAIKEMNMVQGHFDFVIFFHFHFADGSFLIKVQINDQSVKNNDQSAQKNRSNCTIDTILIFQI